MAPQLTRYPQKAFTGSVISVTQLPTIQRPQEFLLIIKKVALNSVRGE